MVPLAGDYRDGSRDTLEGLVSSSRLRDGDERKIFAALRCEATEILVVSGGSRVAL